MKRLSSIWSELFGLFVDDGRFAVSILVWVAVAWLVLPNLGLPPAVPPLVLFGGLVVILVLSAWRVARRRA